MFFQHVAGVRMRARMFDMIIVIVTVVAESPIAAQGLQVKTVPFEPVIPMPLCNRNLDSPHSVFEFCTPVEVSMNAVFSFSAAVGQKQ